MCLENKGRIGVEVRGSHGSFVIHPSYGYDGDENHTPDSDTFGKHWREDPHPEFLLEDLDDLIAALQDAKKYIKSQR
jgi:hypothetical protein